MFPNMFYTYMHMNVGRMCLMENYVYIYSFVGLSPPNQTRRYILRLAYSARSWNCHQNVISSEMSRFQLASVLCAIFLWKYQLNLPLSHLLCLQFLINFHNSIFDVKGNHGHWHNDIQSSHGDGIC